LESRRNSFTGWNGRGIRLEKGRRCNGGRGLLARCGIA
jgi:hypothetical protein